MKIDGVMLELIDSIFISVTVDVKLYISLVNQLEVG